MRTVVGMRLVYQEAPGSRYEPASDDLRRLPPEVPNRLPVLDDGREAISPEVVGEVAPVGCVEEEDVGPIAGREAPDVRKVEDVGGVGGAGVQGLGGGETEAGAGEVHGQGEGLGKGAARVEVRGEGDDGAAVHERAGRGEGEVEEEPARREEDRRDVATGQETHALIAGVLQVVHASGAELYRQG